jgi:hypothetical protein
MLGVSNAKLSRMKNYFGFRNIFPSSCASRMMNRQMRENPRDGFLLLRPENPRNGEAGKILILSSNAQFFIDSLVKLNNRALKKARELIRNQSVEFGV